MYWRWTTCFAANPGSLDNYTCITGTTQTKRQWRWANNIKIYWSANTKKKYTYILKGNHYWRGISLNDIHAFHFLGPLQKELSFNANMIFFAVEFKQNCVSGLKIWGTAIRWSAHQVWWKICGWDLANSDRAGNPFPNMICLHYLNDASWRVQPTKPRNFTTWNHGCHGVNIQPCQAGLMATFTGT